MSGYAGTLILSREDGVSMEHVKQAAAAAVFTLFAYLAHGLDKSSLTLLYTLIWFFTVDTCGGVWSATTRHRLRSRSLREGVSRKAFVFSVLVSVGVGANMLMSSWWVLDILVVACIGTELVSIGEILVAVRGENKFNFEPLDKAIDIIEMMCGHHVRDGESSEGAHSVSTLAVVTPKNSDEPTIMVGTTENVNQERPKK